MIAMILGILLALIPAGKSSAVVVIPPMPQHKPVFVDPRIKFMRESSPLDILSREPIQLEEKKRCDRMCMCLECFHADVYSDTFDEFTEIFNSYEYKVAKNGAPMIRKPGQKSFKFVAKG